VVGNCSINISFWSKKKKSKHDETFTGRWFSRFKVCSNLSNIKENDKEVNIGYLVYKNFSVTLAEIVKDRDYLP